jgi:hypothetical protein
VYPSRTPVLRSLTLWLSGMWGVAIAVMIAMWPFPPRWLTIGSLAFPVYYVVLSLVLHVRRMRARVIAGPDGPVYRT